MRQRLYHESWSTDWDCFHNKSSQVDILRSCSVMSRYLRFQNHSWHSSKIFISHNITSGTDRAWTHGAQTSVGHWPESQGVPGCCEHARGKDAENPWCGACAIIPSWKTEAIRMRNIGQAPRVRARECTKSCWLQKLIYDTDLLRI